MDRNEENRNELPKQKKLIEDLNIQLSEEIITFKINRENDILMIVNNIQLGTGFQKSQSIKLKNYSLTNYLGLQFGKANIGYSLDCNLTYSTGTLPLTHEFSVLWMISTANSKHKQEIICLPEF